jgi:hypothetical protein
MSVLEPSSTSLRDHRARRVDADDMGAEPLGEAKSVGTRAGPDLEIPTSLDRL